MILQGVGHPVPYLGVPYANDPQKGGYMAYAPALDLTTLFEVISHPMSYQDLAVNMVKMKMRIPQQSKGPHPSYREIRDENFFWE